MSNQNSYKKSSKIKLSEHLQMGIAAPQSQSTFFKAGGIVFLVLSLVVTANILYQIHGVHSSTSANSSSAASGSNQSSNSTQSSPQVLGAYSQNTEQVQTTTYTVQKGDTLFNIAQAHNLDWQVIAALNNLSQPYALKQGMQLKLPSVSQ